ncbi:putative murein hydrolase (TIGR00659 family) [Aureimonas jatrophae]|jgi:predicted murein hydrolase (TIGR00659 family)|uniref:TIGR00659 family protein n=1 Tax=Aureimonas jatrophae TaxID=1166073 RepID=A0A1H0KSQ6_9HYPH|nr:LrgB family protein [Aureimonas jatrophae]MBB3948858.1 putative murein hydrolase (TIGR00659 family) [Aureimonas jatrophae]SDO58998.1 TIGR00659 family protein [Aureimonas jatrophae]
MGLPADPAELWAYLSASPLFWLSATLVAFLASQRLAQAARHHPAANPVLFSIVALGLVLAVTRTPYATYFAGAQFVHFLLGPATVALAVPLYRHRRLVRVHVLPLAVALPTGSLVAVVSAVWLARLFAIPPEAIVSLAPKSVTAAVAMGLSEQLGGDPALTAVLCIATGIFGAVIVTPLMNALRIRNYAARGFAVGLTSHGIGTARAFAVDPVAGAFAGIAMALNAVATSLILPVLLPRLL